MFGRSLLVLVVIAFSAWLGTEVGNRDLPVRLISSEAMTPVVAPGEQARVRFKIFRARSCAVHVERILFDSAGNRFVLPDIDFPPGVLPLGEDVFTVFFQVPFRDMDATPVKGKALYRHVNFYTCTAFQRWFSPLEAEASDVYLEIN